MSSQQVHVLPCAEPDRVVSSVRCFISADSTTRGPGKSEVRDSATAVCARQADREACGGSLGHITRVWRRLTPPSPTTVGPHRKQRPVLSARCLVRAKRSLSGGCRCKVQFPPTRFPRAPVRSLAASHTPVKCALRGPLSFWAHTLPGSAEGPQ